MSTDNKGPVADALSDERIAAYREHVEDTLTHSARVEEDALHETGIALLAAYDEKLVHKRHGACGCYGCIAGWMAADREANKETDALVASLRSERDALAAERDELLAIVKLADAAHPDGIALNAALDAWKRRTG